jgi:hypothetical protein
MRTHTVEQDVPTQEGLYARFANWVQHHPDSAVIIFSISLIGFPLTVIGFCISLYELKPHTPAIIGAPVAVTQNYTNEPSQPPIGSSVQNLAATPLSTHTVPPPAPVHQAAVPPTPKVMSAPQVTPAVASADVPRASHAEPINLPIVDSELTKQTPVFVGSDYSDDPSQIAAGSLHQEFKNARFDVVDNQADSDIAINVEKVGGLTCPINWNLQSGQDDSLNCKITIPITVTNSQGVQLFEHSFTGTASETADVRYSISDAITNELPAIYKYTLDRLEN